MTEEMISAISRLGRPVLVLEDQPENQMILKKLLTKAGLECVLTGTGEEALKLSQEQDFGIYIVDLLLPGMDGRTFIRELKKIHPDAVILVQSAINNSSDIIEIMKMGVFDYVVKPIDTEAFHSTLLKSIEYKQLKDMEKGLTSKSAELLKNQLEWLNYKEARRKGSEDSHEVITVDHLKTSLSQGAGIGAMVTLVDLLKADLKEISGDRYSVGKKAMDMLIDNNDSMRIMIDGMENVSAILQNQFPLEPIMASIFIAELPDMIKDLEPLIEERKIKITFPRLQKDTTLQINKNRLKDVIHELALNAIKYSPRGGSVDIFSFFSEGYFCIATRNDTSEGGRFLGVPPEYEKLVTEPFFRLMPPDDSSARFERFGLGLGLTVVDSIARRHGGLFFIHNMNDHTGLNIKPVVVAQLLLPVQEKE